MQPSVATAVAHRCSLCGGAVVPDQWGLVECACGWGGPGDPLESAHGLVRFVMRMDRRLAAHAARLTLARLGSGRWRPGQLSVGYTLALFLGSTIIYAVIAAVLVGLAALAVSLVRDRAWVGAGIVAFLFVVFSLSLLLDRIRAKGVEAPRERFPRLWAALDDVCARTGAPMPHRVVLIPEATAYVFEHRPLRWFFRRELVLAVGAGCLPMLREPDLRSLLAHELAHYRHGHTTLHRYYARAERALVDFTGMLLQGAQTGGIRRRLYNNGSADIYVLLGALVVWIITLPLRVILVVFHLLRLAESRSAEFEADRTAINAYGSQALADMLTGMLVADRTLHGAGKSLRDEMLTHGGSSLYAEMRRHYAALPPNVIVRLRMEALQEFRSLERSHPTTPDRLRAAAIAAVPPPPGVPLTPAADALTPSGATGPEEIEAELTALLFAPKQRDRRRR
jgi:Zn-dependent protease with chaperone function